MKYVGSLECLPPSARLELSTYVRDWKSSEDTARRFTFGKLVPVSDRIPIERITIWISFLHGDINRKIHSRCQVVTAHERLSIKCWGIALDRSHCPLSHLLQSYAEIYRCVHHKLYSGFNLQRFTGQTTASHSNSVCALQQ